MKNQQEKYISVVPKSDIQQLTTNNPDQNAYQSGKLESKFTDLVEQAFLGVYIINPTGHIIYGNKKLYEFLGIEKKNNVNLFDYIHPEDLPKQKSFFASLNIDEEGKEHHFHIKKPCGDELYAEAFSKLDEFAENTSVIIGVILDKTEQKRIADLNKFLAYYDQLTGLPNRQSLDKKLDEELIISKTLQRKFALLVLDLDRFKNVNETLGISIGNKLLKEISVRLQNCITDKAFLSTLGSDQFCIVLENISNIEQVIQFAKKIMKSLEEPFNIEQYELFITLSIGASIFPNDGEDRDSLIKYAFSALMYAKANGKNTCHLYTSSMNIESYRKFALEGDLRKALELNQLELFYQPKVNVQNQQIIGAEALLRWNHPDWGLITPDEFMPIAEEIGLSNRIVIWVKKTIASHIRSWDNAGLMLIPISYNLSAARFFDKDIVSNIVEVLNKVHLSPEDIEIELTESSLFKNEKVVLSVLDELKDIGIRIALDDFGAGYSSLSYLKKFKGRINTLKIHRSFIEDIEDDHHDRFILKSIIGIAHHLDMKVVVEDVETTKQFEILKEYKCDAIQGMLFSKPVPPVEFASLLEKKRIELPEDISVGKEVNQKNRRNYFRIDFKFPLKGTVRLIEMHGKNVESGKTNILIENIGLGGLRFLSNLKFPMHREIVLEFETRILDEHVKLNGYVVWNREVKTGIYQYGIEFIINENERPVKLLNKLALTLRNTPLPKGCSFLEGNKHSYFEK